VSAVATAAPTVVEDKVRAPANDQRQYRVVELANGMQVLLTSDATCDSAAAALTVRCGTFQDTDDRPGLAHFHEHMLFLGTEKYPKEDEYTRYLSEHGGDGNAFTMNEYTTYYFKVASPHLEGALDRFSQFFVGPTFDKGCVEREMKAVDSESTNYSTEDGWRLQQIMKATAAPDHPFFRFDVGNLGTLGADDPMGTRQKLIDWNKEHYQAGAMRLAVVGRQSLEDLEQLIVTQFGSVRDGSGPAFKYDTLPWPKEKLGRVVYCVPLKEARSISVCWALPSADKQLFAKPETYMAHLLGHEGMGSLHDVLNERGWVDQLSAGPSQSFSDGQLFAVNITLTPEGDENRENVMALLFEWVEMVRQAGPRREVFEEIASLNEISFAHKEESPANDDFAVSAAMSLHKYPAAEVLRGPFALDEWKPEVVTEYLKALTPDNCLVFLTSSAFSEEVGKEDAKVKGWQNEEWYGAPFREEPINADRLAKWKLAEGGESGLALPMPNPFIPTDFSLRGDPAASGLMVTKLPMEVTPPTLICKTPYLRVWQKTDNAFKTPRQYVLAHIHTPVYDQGPREVALIRLFCSVVYDDLNAYAYDASCAGLNYSLDFSDSFSMSCGGFSHKLSELLDVFLSRLREVAEDCEVAEGEGGAVSERGMELLSSLEVQRQLLIQDYKNLTREEPYAVGSYYLGQTMLRDSWHIEEYLSAIEEPVTLKDLARAAREGFKKTQIELFVHGNATVEEARTMADRVVEGFSALGSEPLEEVSRRKITKLTAGTSTVFEYDLAAKNPAQENCCTQNIYQVGAVGVDAKRDAALSVICHVASTSCYQRLRTEEQLGYIVQSGVWAEGHVAGLNVIVQGKSLPPREVDQRIEAWLASYQKELEDMSAEDFENNVQALLSDRTQRMARMVQETNKHWSEIKSRRYRFDRTARGVAALKALTKADCVALFRETLAEGAPERRKFSSRILGTSANGVRTEGEGVLANVEDIRAFQATVESWPRQPDVELPDLASP